MAPSRRQAAPADTGDRSYYRTSDNGVECTHALRAALGRDGYIAWLRGTMMKYLWRVGVKPGVDPTEDVVKTNWYGRELERVLRDPNA